MKLLSNDTPAGRKFTGFLVLLGIFLISLFAVKISGIAAEHYRTFASGVGGAYLIYCGGNVVKEQVKKKTGGK